MCIEFPQIDTYRNDCVGANQKIFKNIPDWMWIHLVLLLQHNWQSLSLDNCYVYQLYYQSEFLITVLGPAHDTDPDHIPYQVERGRRGCDYDRVEILELATNSSRGQYCGDQPPEAPVSTRGGMVVRWRCYEMSRTLSLCLLFLVVKHPH